MLPNSLKFQYYSYMSWVLVGGRSVGSDGWLLATVLSILNNFIIDFTDEDLDRALMYKSVHNPILQAAARAILNCTTE